MYSISSKNPYENGWYKRAESSFMKYYVHNDTDSKFLLLVTQMHKKAKKRETNTTH